MANYFENKDRRVIPNFRSYSKTASLGELDSPHSFKQKIETEDRYFIELKQHWIESKSTILASELISCGLIVNSKDLLLNEAAKYILKHESECSISQLNLAKYVLGYTDENNSESQEDFSLLTESNRIKIYNKISLLKETIKHYPKSAINYVEQARLYSILGQKEKSIGAIKIALNLGCNNRYIIRSGIRLCAHFDEIDIPLFYLKKGQIVDFDPWVLSAEISLFTILGKRSTRIRKANKVIEKGEILPFSMTELAAALATVEYFEGNLKKTKKLLSNALIQPNDNSLAQAEWILNRDPFFEFYPERFNSVKSRYEALALNSYNNGKWEETHSNAVDWYIDMPFTRRPVILASYVASMILNKQEEAITICRAGLESNPNNRQIINNLAYSLALANQIDDAEKEISKIDFEGLPEDANKACMIATYGLIKFRKGDPVSGRTYYEKSLKIAKKLGNKHLQWVALINLVREELKLTPSYKPTAEEILSKVPTQNIEDDVKAIKEAVMSEFNL